MALTRYKVVTGKRQSIISISTFADSPLNGANIIRTYEKGTEVVAHPGTFGILVFDTKYSAQTFMEMHSFIRGSGGMILRVRPKGRAVKVTKLLVDGSASALSNIRHLLRIHKHVSHIITECANDTGHAFYSGIMPAPIGTLAYKSVVVLD